MDEATITPYRDGPLLVRGPFTLLTRTATRSRPGRDDVALCRCGKSRCARSATAPTARRASARRARRSGREPRADARRRLAARLRPRARDRRRAAATIAPRSQASSRCARPAGLEPRRARARPRGCRRASSGSWRARPPARSTAATFSWTASASTCSSKNVGRARVVDAEPPQRRARSGGWASTTSSRTARGGRRSRRAGGGAGRSSDIRFTVASVTPGSTVEVGAVGAVEARARPSRRRTAGRGSGRRAPPPYSSAWISTSAAFGGPHSRGSAHECGSASLSW